MRTPDFVRTFRGCEPCITATQENTVALQLLLFSTSCRHNFMPARIEHPHNGTSGTSHRSFRRACTIRASVQNCMICSKLKSDTTPDLRTLKLPMEMMMRIGSEGRRKVAVTDVSTTLEAPLQSHMSRYQKHHYLRASPIINGGNLGSR
jgi:hypothetical protein